MARDVRALALDYLRTHQVMTLATQGPLGLWAAAVFYANDGFRLTFLSAGHTRHAQNLTAVPRVAATIQEDYRDWPEIKGIQLEGVVVQLEGGMGDTAVGNPVTHAVGHYLQRYPFLQQGDPQLTAGLARVNWYQLVPDRLYFIDNSLGLGHRDEVDLG